MSAALTKYLKDFSKFVPPEAPSAFDFEAPVSAFESLDFAEPEDVVDLDEEKRKAFADGEDKARRLSLESHETELANLRDLHAQEIEAVRIKYEDEIAMHLATSVISMRKAIAENVESVCFRLFETVMERELAEKAASDLAVQISREIEGGFAGTIKITGPDRLISKIRDDLGAVDNQVDYDVSADIDVQVQMDNSVLVTRLAEFFQSVRGLADE